MPASSCLAPDPVELLLRSILRRSALLAAAATVGACTSVPEPEGESSAQEQREDQDDAGEHPRDGGSGATDAHAAVDETTFVPPSGPPEMRVADAGALGPALACQADGRFPVAAGGLKTAERYDYLSLRQRRGYVNSPASDGGAESWSAGDFTLLSETGQKCATAQGAECAETVARHPVEFVRTVCVQACVELSAVTTSGDSVLRWAGVQGMRTLLGEIDSGEDALLLVGAAGYDLACNDAESTSWREVPEGFEVYATRTTKDCAPIEISRFHLSVSRSGEIKELGSLVLRQLGACAGRKPAGLMNGGRDAGRSKLGDYLAQMAHLEAASVVAFERLANELAAFGAPRPLVDAALAARADEVRHADLIARLALLNGGEPVEPAVAPWAPRGLEAIALENAVEGCVRETYGALVGGYQAMHACNRALRVAMERIAQDEARHAALSHQVHRWMMPRLGAAAGERVRHAQQRAIFELAAEIAHAPDPELASVAGLPAAQTARLLLDELSKTLWRPALRPRRSGAARA